MHWHGQCMKCEGDEKTNGKLMKQIIKVYILLCYKCLLHPERVTSTTMAFLWEIRWQIKKNIHTKEKSEKFIVRVHPCHIYELLE